MTTSTLSTFHIDESAVRNDHYLEIWWAYPKKWAEGDYWEDSGFIVVFYDGDTNERPLGVLLEADIENLSQEDWSQIQTLEELPLRFNYKDHKNLTLPELIRVVVKELTTPTS